MEHQKKLWALVYELYEAAESCRKRAEEWHGKRKWAMENMCWGEYRGFYFAAKALENFLLTEPEAAVPEGNPMKGPAGTCNTDIRQASEVSY